MWLHCFFAPGSNPNKEQLQYLLHRSDLAQMAMDLQITTTLGERYETTHKTVVPMQYYNIIRPDADLPVYIDPNNKNKLFIDFQQAWMDIAKKNPIS